ncbi:MAG: DUF6650 family protein [Roseburia sp.]
MKYELNGISTPFGGISWNKTNSLKDKFSFLLLYLESKRILVNPIEMEKKEWCIESVNPQKALQAIVSYAQKELGVGTDKTENRTRLQTAGYELSENIVKHTLSGETATLDFAAADMNAIAVTEKLNTHKHGRDYHHEIGKIGMEIGMEYSYMNTIIRISGSTNFAL